MSTVIPITKIIHSTHHPTCLPSIQEWIDCNSYFTHQNLIWNIGVTNAEHILNIESTVRQDLNCKHWKYWRVDCFREAMKTIRELNRASYIIKSEYNNYISKGSYIFIYKTVVPQNSRLFHTLHS